MSIDEYCWNKVVGVCEQLDHHNGQLTVKETIEFSKMCQLGNTDNFQCISPELKVKLKLKTEIC